LASVQRIVEDVRRRGDRALFAYARRFDGVRLTRPTVRLDPSKFPALARTVPAALRTALREAARRIRAYHERQALRPFTMRTAEGTLAQVVRPLRRVGVYVPGGLTVYASSVLMNVIPAQVAGVDEIAVATPCRGGLSPVLAFTFGMLGIREVYRIGGAQAIAALAYGTQSVPAVDKVVGPGRNVVALAKRIVYGAVGIDMMAGSSEVAILADGSADPTLVALDMLAQAEHGSGDELAVCVTESRRAAERITGALRAEIAHSPVREVFERLKAGGLSVCVTGSRRESIALVNGLAPEHLQIMTRTAESDVAGVRAVGAVFLGPNSPVALGDYFVGTNHILPTGGAARYASALGVSDFQRRMSVVRISASGLRRSARHVSVLARAERFVHHALSVERRLTRR
jgi:histidinol dehydrogenase